MNPSGFVKSANVIVGDAKIIVMEVMGKTAVLYEQKEVLHSHSYYEIQVLKKGSCNIKAHNRNMLFSEGEMIIIRPGDLHVPAIKLSDSLEKYALALRVEKCPGEEGYFDYFKEILDKHALIPLKVSRELMEKVLLFFDLRPASIRETFLINLTAHEILYGIFDTFEDFVMDNPLTNSEGIVLREHEEALLDVLVNSPIQLTLPDIAERLGYSVRQVQRFIQKKYGMPYIIMLRTRKIDSIKKLLTEEPDIPVSEIAARVGYNSETSLYRDFKKHVGCTPCEYRKNAMK
ncbi:MAG: AraC family transcriptional regulator [Lachnospiraceae bacterium]|nr:AraC family transcriptional regulator [Lachnospiraceae bacterium]